jgi:segregation and condensation protein A
MLARLPDLVFFEKSCATRIWQLGIYRWSARRSLELLPMETDYKVKLEVFEGPLDLLLYLIKRDEIDIYDISLERITKQYLEYLQAFKELNIDIAGEFIVMAANLIYLKSRSLLPVDQQPPDEEAEEDDPRWDLIRQLIEYKKFKEAAAQLQTRALEQERMFARAGLKVADFASAPLPLGEVGIFQLINALQTVIKRVEAREDLQQLFGEHFTVSDKIESILRLIGSGVTLKFSELFAQMASRIEIVVTFLALLELIRLKQVRATQMSPFEEIEIAPAVLN